MSIDTDRLSDIAKTIRYWSLRMTTEAGSGHLTSSLSATDIMTALFFDENFHFDVTNPKNPANDRLIFSKGHASPLFYSLWAVAGAVDFEKLHGYSSFKSPLE